MTLKIPATDLASALKAAAAIVETKNMLPILAMVRMEANEGRLTLTTTNLDVEYRQALECDGSLDPICVDAKKLRDMASKAKGDLKMVLAGSILKMTGKARWSIPALPADDFPLMPVDRLGKPMAFSPADIVKRLLWAADPSPTRAHLSGIYLNNNGGKAHFVATNGHTMPMIQTAVKWPAKAPNVIMAPAFLKALPDADGALEWDDIKARFTAGDVVVTGKMIDGTYPDYARVIPAPCEPYAVDVNDLLGAIDRVRPASDMQQRRLRIKRQNGSLAVKIEGTSGFEGEEDVAADCSEGFEMGVNADYLSGMLAAMGAEAVSVEQVDANSPIAMRPTVQDAGQSVMGVLMPMRI